MGLINPLKLFQEAAAEVSPVYTTLLLVSLPTTAIGLFVMLSTVFPMMPGDLWNLTPNLDLIPTMAPAAPWVYVLFYIDSYLLAPLTQGLLILLAYQQVTGNQIDMSQSFLSLQKNGFQFLLLWILEVGIYIGFALLLLLLSLILSPFPVVRFIVNFAIVFLLKSYLLFSPKIILIESGNVWQGFWGGIQLCHANFLTVASALALPTAVRRIIDWISNLLITPPEMFSPILQPLFWLQDPIAQARLRYLIDTGIGYFIGPLWILYFTLLYVRVRSSGESREIILRS